MKEIIGCKDGEKQEEVIQLDCGVRESCLEEVIFKNFKDERNGLSKEKGKSSLGKGILFEQESIR